MKFIERAEAQFPPRPILCTLALFCALVLPSFAQIPAAQSTTSPQPAASAFRGILTLDGPWRFQTGDDLRWAEPSYDDSTWPAVSLSQPLTNQGFPAYTGFAWYRLHLQPQQLAALGDVPSNAPLQMLVAGNSVGQLGVFVNNVEVGHTSGMTEPMTEVQSPPFVVQLSAPDASGSRVLAIRTWAGPTVTIRRGLLDKVEVGTPSEIAEKLQLAKGRQWNENAVSAILLTFLFLCVSGLGASLFLAQRHHSEYLWLAILCLSVAAGGAADAAFGLAVMPLTVYRVFTICSGRFFMAVTLEFVLRFTASKSKRAVRIVQIGVLVLPLFHFLGLMQIYSVLSVAAEVIFCSTICVLLFQAWRAGRREAGIMLVPFFLAATADSANTVLEFAASKHWIPDSMADHRFYFGPIQYGIGTIAYTVFLASLVAVILYRFIRVSQDEQRSNAEIAAARSVQALLIPTQLPSNRNFMLESAYLPVNGVGGDFFQVLPLKDDSLLIVVGDVSGKGLQAAMNSSTLVGALRNEISHDPSTILNHLNRVLIGAVSSPGAVPELDAAPCFATCLCARIYPDGSMTVANAGHLSPYRDGRELDLPPGLPLGVIAESQYEQANFQLERGDRLVFLSDGVVEATNSEGELFGFERTQQVSNEPARYIAQTAQRFGQTDDITVVSLYISSRTAHKHVEALETV